MAQITLICIAFFEFLVNFMFSDQFFFYVPVPCKPELISRTRCVFHIRLTKMFLLECKKERKSERTEKKEKAKAQPKHAGLCIRTPIKF